MQKEIRGEYDNEPYINLASAVILQALREYLTACKRCIKTKNADADAWNLMMRISRFIKSDWGRNLLSFIGIDMSADEILRAVRESGCIGKFKL